MSFVSSFVLQPVFLCNQVLSNAALSVKPGATKKKVKPMTVTMVDVVADGAVCVRKHTVHVDNDICKERGTQQSSQ